MSEVKNIINEYAQFFCSLIERKDFDDLNNLGKEWLCDLIQAALDE